MTLLMKHVSAYFLRTASLSSLSAGQSKRISEKNQPFQGLCNTVQLLEVRIDNDKMRAGSHNLFNPKFICWKFSHQFHPGPGCFSNPGGWLDDDHVMPDYHNRIASHMPSASSINMSDHLHYWRAALILNKRTFAKITTIQITITSITNPITVTTTITIQTITTTITIQTITITIETIFSILLNKESPSLRSRRSSRREILQGCAPTKWSAATPMYFLYFCIFEFTYFCIFVFLYFVFFHFFWSFKGSHQLIGQFFCLCSFGYFCILGEGPSRVCTGFIVWSHKDVFFLFPFLYLKFCIFCDFCCCISVPIIIIVWCTSSSSLCSSSLYIIILSLINTSRFHTN